MGRYRRYHDPESLPIQPLEVEWVMTQDHDTDDNDPFKDNPYVN